MGAIAFPINPRKLFRWSVETPGLQSAYAQKCKIPKIVVKSAKHGNGPFDENTASRIELGMVELETLKPDTSSAAWWKDWFALVINLGTGSMSEPSIYKRTLIITEFAADGLTIVDIWELSGCYPAEIELTDLDKLADGNAIDKVKLMCDRISYAGSGDPTLPAVLGLSLL